MSTRLRTANHSKGADLATGGIRECGAERPPPGIGRLLQSIVAFRARRSHRSPRELSMPTPTQDVAALLNEKEAARFLSMSYRTLQSWRSAGEGPPYLKLGRSIRYRRGDLIAWVDASRHT